MHVELEPFELSLADPLQTAAGEITEREGVLVRLAAEDAVEAGTSPTDAWGDAAVYGLGEATPLPGWTESFAACRRALDDAAERLRDASPEDALVALERHAAPDASGAPHGDLDASGTPHGDLDASGTPHGDPVDALAPLEETPAARHGVELALADLAARRAAEPLYRRLGGDQRVETVTVNATVGDGSPERTAERARDARDAGYSALKVKVGAGTLERDVERLRAVRAAVGEAVELRADANGAWDPQSARAALSELASLDLAYVEQPLAAPALEAHAALRSTASTDLALDESVADAGLEAVLAADAADVIVLKPMVLGGPRRTVTAARRARAAGLDVVVTTTVDGPVASAGAVHVAAALAPIRACGLATADRLEHGCCPDPVPVTDGTVAVSNGPGLGVDPAACRAYDAE